MTLEKIGELIDLFGNVYWSAPAEYVFSRIRAWYPEITDEQIQQATEELSGEDYWHHCWLVREDLEEPEIAAEHLIGVGDDDFENYLDVRIEGPYCDHDEQTMRILSERPEEYPAFEMYTMFRFAREELGLDDEWTRELVDMTMFSQALSLCDGDSWVMSLLQQLRWINAIEFSSIEQLSRFRDIGNRLYQVLPNPVLKGWRPCDLKESPVLLDDIPEDLEEIQSDREKIEQMIDSIRQAANPEGDEATAGDDEEESKPLVSVPKTAHKVGRNDPCPCGSGKKYKKCCGKGQ